MTDLLLQRLGYWHGPYTPEWPDVRRFVDAEWDEDERAEVWSHLRAGFTARAYLGRSDCRICGEAVGSLEVSDGTYIWPEGLAHYVREHSVRLPVEFVEHVRSRRRELEEASVIDEWWRTFTTET